MSSLRGVVIGGTVSGYSVVSVSSVMIEVEDRSCCVVRVGVLLERVCHH